MDTGEQAAAEESSANRRERLLALRSAAAAASSSSPAAAPPPLPPPAWDLPEPDLTPSSAPRPPARFGFYTNPGAAFSSAAVPHKRKSPDTLLGPSPAPAPPHGNYGNNYPPPRQHHMAPSTMEPAPPGTIPWRSPMHFQTPTSEYRGAPPGPPPHWNPHSAAPAQDSYPPSPNFGFRGSNVGRGGNPINYGPRGGPMNYGPRGSPMNCGPRGSPVNYIPRGSPMNYEPRGSPVNYGPRGSPMNYGPRGSPCSSYERGRGDNYYSSPGSRGRGGRGGSGFQNHSGGQERDYYKKSMVDDPWKYLQPIVGSILIPIGGGGAMNYGPRGSPMNYGPRGSPMNYGPRGSPMNYGPRGSPCSSSEQGRGDNNYSSPGSRGRGGRGGSGFQNHFGGQEQRDCSKKSMVDDPWKNLQPVVGSILIPIGGGGDKSWLPESLRTKKDNILDQGRVISTSASGLSLAEYLDLSFNEVSNET